MMAFSTKLSPVSSASSLMKRLCGNTSMSSPSMACNSFSLPLLLLASTSWLNFRSLIRVEFLLEAHGMYRCVVVGLHPHLKLQQPALGCAVVGDEVDRLLLLDADELQRRGLLDQVPSRPFVSRVPHLNAVVGEPLSRDVAHAPARPALRAWGSGDLRLQIGAVEGVVMHQQIA